MALLDALFDPSSASSGDAQNAGLLSMLLGASGGLLSSSGPSRLPVSTGQVLGAGLGGGFQGLQNYNANRLAGLQAQGLMTQNALQGLTLEGYKRMQQAIGGGAPTTSSVVSSNMTGANPGYSPTPIPNATGTYKPTPIPNADPGGYKAAAMDLGVPSNPRLLSSIAAPQSGAAMPVTPTAGNQPPPLFNMNSIYQQYRVAASTPGMQQVAAQLLGLIQKGTPEGSYVGTDGGIYSRPGYNAFVQGESASKAAGSAPYDIAKSLVYQAGRAVPVGPDQTVHTGMDVMDPRLSSAITNILAGKPIGAQAATPSSVPSPRIASGSSQPGTDATGFPTRPTRAPGGGIQAPYSPEGMTFQKEILPEQFKEAQKGYQSAQALQGQLNEMDHNIELLNSSGWSSTGPGANTKFGTMRFLNTLADTAGIPKKAADGSPFRFDPLKIAGWEDFNKLSTRMGFELAKTLGSREAMMIVQQAIGAVPNAGNSYLGARTVSSSLRQAAQRQEDYYEFLQQFAASHGGNTFGADVAFNKTHPVQEYSNRAIINAIPPDVMHNAPPEAIARLQQNPNLIGDFMTRYGR